MCVSILGWYVACLPEPCVFLAPDILNCGWHACRPWTLRNGRLLLCTLPPFIRPLGPSVKVHVRRIPSPLHIVQFCPLVDKLFTHPVARSTLHPGRSL